MSNFSAACLALGITNQLYAMRAIYKYWLGPGPLPKTPWPYRTVSGVASGLLLGAGLCSWLM